MVSRCTHLVVEPQSVYSTLIDILNQGNVVILEEGGCGGCPQEVFQQHGGEPESDQSKAATGSRGGVQCRQQETHQFTVVLWQSRLLLYTHINQSKILHAQTHMDPYKH